MNIASPKKILIIDNDLVIRYTLKKIFSNYLTSNLKIYTSSDGLQGLGYVYVVRPDLIIIDTTLPKYSGRELTEYIKSNPTLSDTTVVLLNEDKEYLTGLPHNFLQISKSDHNFPSNLIELVSKLLSNGDYQIIHTGLKNTKDLKFKLINYLSKKILSYSNISDIESQKVLSKNIFVKSAYYLKYLFDQFLTSIYLTFFYVFVGKKDYEETVDQKQRDVEKFRVKTFPALAFGLALVFFGIIQFFLLSGVFVALTYVATAPAYAASYTWDGGGTDGTCGGQAGDGNKWSCAANWSSDIVPTAADNVTFNATSTKNATVDAAFSGGVINTLTITSGYSGTITLARDFSLSSNFSQDGGTFNASNQNFAIAIVFGVTNGTFTASSATTRVGNSFTISGGGVFNHNSGTFDFYSSGGTLSCNNVAFNRVTFTNSGSQKTMNSNCSFPLGASPNIAGPLVVNGTLSGTGTFSHAGTLTFNSGSVISGFSGLNTTANGIVVSGATLDFSTYTSFVSAAPLSISSGTLTLPSGTDLNSNLTISGGTFNAPSGNMTLAGSLTISGSPTFNANGGTFIFDSSIGGTLSCNNVTFSLVQFRHSTLNKTVSSNCTLPLGADPIIGAVGPSGITLNGTLTGSGTYTQRLGDNSLIVNAGSVISGFTGLDVTRLTVGGATMDFSAYTFLRVELIYTQTSGTISFPNNADVNYDFNFSGGTFNAPSGNLYLARDFNISGSAVFNHNNGTLVFDSLSGGTITCNNQAINMAVFSFTNLKTVASSCNLPLGNNPTITSLLTLNGTLTGTGSLTVLSTFTINTGGLLSGFSGFVGNTLTVAGATSNFSGYTTFSTIGAITLTSGSLSLPIGADVNGALNISGGTFNAPSGNMTIAAGLAISGAPTFNANSGNIVFDGSSSAGISCNNVTFSKVTFSHSAGTKTVNTNCNLPLGNNPSVGTNASNSVVNINGGVLSGTGTLAVVGYIGFISGSSNLSGFSGITVTGALTVAGSTLDLSGYSPATMSYFTLSSGSFTTPSAMTVSADFAITGGTFNHNNGTITFVGSGAIGCNNATLNLVSFTGQTGTRTINSNCNLPMGNNPAFASAVVLNGTLSGTGTLTQPSSFTLNAGATLSGFSGLIVSSTFTVSGATMNLGSMSSAVFNSTVVLNSGTLTLPSGSHLNNTLTISGGTFNAPSGNMTLAGALTISGSPTFNHNSGTITFDGTTTATLSCNNVSFNRVIFGHTAGVKTVASTCNLPLGNDPVATTGGDVTVSGTLTGSGTFTEGGKLILNTGSSLSGFSGLITLGDFQVAGATANFSNYSTLEVRKDFIMSSGTFTAPTLFKAYDEFAYQGGTFNHNNGTVELLGDGSQASQAIQGSTTFYNLKKTFEVTNDTAVSFQNGITQNILGTLTLKGTAAHPLNVGSLVAGSQYTINAANVDIQYLKVSDFNNTGASVIQAAGKNITNSGNNTRWNFDNPSISSVAPIYLTNGSNIANNKPGYTFNITDPQASDTVKYQIQIDNNSDFSSPEVDYTSVIAAQGARTFTVGQAAGTGTYTTGSENQSLSDAAYYVRIKGIDSTSGDGGYSTVNGTSSAFTVDTTKPTGSVIFGYKTDSTSRDIYLILTATDNLSGVDKMMISENSNFANATFEEYKTSKAYTVSEGYGQKTIYIKFRDRAGNESINYIVTPSYSQVVVTPSTTPVVTQVPVSYGTPIGGNVTDGLSVLALRVIGSTNAPLANVSINIPSLGINTTTDENGLIVLQNVPLGSYDVLGLFNNKEFNQNLDVSGDQSVITIKLEDTPNSITIILTVTVLILVLIIILGGVLLYRKSKNKNEYSKS